MVGLPRGLVSQPSPVTSGPPHAAVTECGPAEVSVVACHPVLPQSSVQCCPLPSHICPSLSAASPKLSLHPCWMPALLCWDGMGWSSCIPVLRVDFTAQEASGHFHNPHKSEGAWAVLSAAAHTVQVWQGEAVVGPCLCHQAFPCASVSFPALWCRMWLQWGLWIWVCGGYFGRRTLWAGTCMTVSVGMWQC